MPAIIPKWSETPAAWRIIWFASSVPLALGNYFLSAQLDMVFARHAGGVSSLPSGWTQFSTPDWMFGSLLGPALTLSPSLFFLLLWISGALAAWLAVQSCRMRTLAGGFSSWLLAATALLWIIRVPLPVAWTIYYHVAVRY